MIKSINLSSLTSSLISSSSFSFLLPIVPNHPCPFFYNVILQTIVRYVHPF
nr:MAG TPA: hypothetical protein [Caudoviricetes sp.]